ncbi:hypothetical protein THAOC_33964, partial [Thalassiosira oceanica]
MQGYGSQRPPARSLRETKSKKQPTRLPAKIKIRVLGRVVVSSFEQVLLQFLGRAVVLPLSHLEKNSGVAIELPLLPPTLNSTRGKMDDEVETNQQRCTPADEAVPASCDGGNDPPRPLALLPGGDNGSPVPTPIQQEEQLALGDEEAEVHESALSFVEEDSDRAPIPIHQQEQQLDNAKRKAKAEISTAHGARGKDERDSTMELVAEERDEDLRPIAARSRVGASLGEAEEEAVSSISTPRPHSGPSLCLADCDNDPPVPIQQQVQLLALDDKAAKNKKKQESKTGEQKSVMTFVEEEGANCAPIPIQQQMHQFDDAEEKTTPEISTENGASGIHERDSTTELRVEEMEEDEVNLGPSVRSRVGASLEELEACVKVSSMPAPRQNDAADARLSPEEIPIYDGIVVTMWTRLQTWVQHFHNNYKSILGLTILVISSAIVVGIVFGGRRNKPSAPIGNQSSMVPNTALPSPPPIPPNGDAPSESPSLSTGSSVTSRPNDDIIVVEPNPNGARSSPYPTPYRDTPSEPGSSVLSGPPN